MSSYNNGQPILLDSIDKSELNQAATDFSEGLEPLKQLLLCMWDKGLKTIACCKGYHGNYLATIFPTQILMQPNNDIFCYLSSEIIDSPYVKLLTDDQNRQEILIYGEKRDELLQKITRDILFGKKNNTIVDKIVEPQVRVEAYVYGLRINGFSEEDIEMILPKLNEYAKLEEQAEYYEDKFGELYANGKLPKKLEEELDVFSACYNEIRSFIFEFILKRQQNVSEDNELYNPKR